MKTIKEILRGLVISTSKRNLIWDGAIELDCKVAIYVPSTYAVDNSVDNSHYVKTVMNALSGMFGGATSTAGVGCWKSNEGALVLEDVQIVYAYCTSEQLKHHHKEVLATALWLKQEMQQEAISVEFNNKLRLV